MKIKFIFFTLLLIFTVAHGSDRAGYLLNLINSELKEVRKLNKHVGARDPELLLRMAELYLEKARVVREQENKRYLNFSAKKRRRINKSKFFKKSHSYFLKAQKVSYFILKKFRNFDQKSDVYYILGFNAKEFKKKQKAKSFFNKAYSSAHSSVSKEKSALALAEIFYNEKKS